jgi:CRISPR-associated endonuclease Csn1
MGVRIFSDGRDAQSSEPLAVERRTARGMRRNRDRTLSRQQHLMQVLTDIGLMPAERDQRKALLDETGALENNPYAIRARALDEAVPLHHLGRALFHLGQRRGFQSNRRADGKSKDDDKSLMKGAFSKLANAMIETKARTYGAFLYQRLKAGDGVRIRPVKKNNKNDYAFYPQRSDYQHELTMLWQAQQRHYPALLTEENHAKVFDAIFYQRPLMKPDVGYCQFEEGEKRAPKAYPVFQQFRILEDVNHLMINTVTGEKLPLSQKQRDEILKLLNKKKDVTFDTLRKNKTLGFSQNTTFNLETEERTKLKGNTTASRLSGNDAFGEQWFAFSDTQQAEIVTNLLEEDNEDTLIAWLQQHHNLSWDTAEHVSKIALEAGYGRLSLKAMKEILPHLEYGMTYDKAVAEVYPHHSDFRPTDLLDELPYYGKAMPKRVMPAPKATDPHEKRYGKINNPTVHIGLNQIRKLINELIQCYGRPTQIVVELARELKENQEQANLSAKRRKENQKLNEEAEREIGRLGYIPNHRNREKYKLWITQAKDATQRQCPFTGQQIRLEDVFREDSPFEIEHLLPFSRSYNDSLANKVLACRTANREKTNQSSYEAFGGHATHYADIMERVKLLPYEKRWRFQPDAWDIARGKGEDVIARLLNDTKYLSRLTKEYLSHICQDVYVVTGGMTALLRGKWGLNDWLGDKDQTKERKDHRHHAVDAFVIACISRGMMQRISAAAKYAESQFSHRLVDQMPPPFEGFQWDEGKHTVEQIVVSHKPDHGNARRAISPPQGQRPYTTGKLHKETAYGLIECEGKKVFVTRKKVGDFKNADDIQKVVDKARRQQFLDFMQKATSWPEGLDSFIQKTGMKRLRIKTDKKIDSMVGIREKGNKNEKIYKYYEGDNIYTEIYQSSFGKMAKKWQAETVSMFDVHQRGFIQKWKSKEKRENSTAKLIMRLHKQDLIAITLSDQAIKGFKLEDKLKKNERLVCRVRKMSGGKISIIPHYIAHDTVTIKENGKTKETREFHTWKISPEQLRNHNARKIHVDILGRVHDPMAQTHVNRVPIDVDDGDVRSARGDGDRA